MSRMLPSRWRTLFQTRGRPSQHANSDILARFENGCSEERITITWFSHRGLVTVIWPVFDSFRRGDTCEIVDGENYIKRLTKYNQTMFLQNEYIFIFLTRVVSQHSNNSV